MAAVGIKRVYLPADDADGWRVLVDRLWPRGLAKARARVDHWDKSIAPSDGLRQWFRHEPGKWPEFQRRYFAELDAQAEAVQALREAMRGHARVCLLFAARDEARNNAVALRAYLQTHGDAS